MSDVPSAFHGQVPPHNEEAEVSLLGMLLLAPDASDHIARLVVDERLKPESFYRERLRLIFRSMLALVDQREPVDIVTVCDRLSTVGELAAVGGRDYVHSLPSIMAGTNWLAYARTIVGYAEDRAVLVAARDLADAVLAGDRNAQADAERRISRRDQRVRAKTREQRTEDLVTYVENRQSTDWNWPFLALDEITGGLWPSHLTVLIGHSQHGKSVLADQILEHVSNAGGRCCAYLTEMSELERDMRYVSRAGGIPFKLIRNANLPDKHMPEFARVVQKLPFDIEQVGQRTADDLARDIRRRGWDVCVIDLLNVVSGRKVEDIDHNIGMFAALAADTGTHIIGCQHLNRSAFSREIQYAPRPTIGQIRGSGAIHDLATNVLSVYRLEERDFEDQPTGKPGELAEIEFLKLKNGVAGGLQAVFDGNRMRFLPKQHDWEAAAA